ncbi:MAG: hypothetical protein M1814_000931 [Vezdaea aestivalis]|nr:MAG: hypothetical protein M1814_000931 [Vezdaea aestivalis]
MVYVNLDANSFYEPARTRTAAPKATRNASTPDKAKTTEPHSARVFTDPPFLDTAVKGTPALVCQSAPDAHERMEAHQQPTSDDQEASLGSTQSRLDAHDFPSHGCEDDYTCCHTPPAANITTLSGASSALDGVGGAYFASPHMNQNGSMMPSPLFTEPEVTDNASVPFMDESSQGEDSDTSEDLVDPRSERHQKLKRLRRKRKLGRRRNERKLKRGRRPSVSDTDSGSAQHYSGSTQLETPLNGLVNFEIDGPDVHFTIRFSVTDKSNSLTKALHQRRSHEPPQSLSKRTRFTAEDDAKLIDLKVSGKPWSVIAAAFPNRSMGTLQVRYSTKLKHTHSG